MRFRKPDVNGDDAGLHTEAEKEQQEDHALPEGRHLRRQKMETGKIESTAEGCKEKESDQEHPRAGMRHDEEKDTCLACFLLLVLEADQAVCGKRHDFPRHQEEERVRRGENQRQAEQLKIEEEPECAQVAASFHVPQVSEGVERNGGGEHREGHAEECREWIEAESPGEYRVAEGKGNHDGRPGEDGGGRTDQIEKGPSQRRSAGDPSRGDRTAIQCQTACGTRQPHDDSTQKQVGNHWADASRSISPSIWIASAKLEWK